MSHLKGVQLSSVKQNTVRNCGDLLEHFVLKAWAKVTAVFGVTCHRETVCDCGLRLRLVILLLIGRRLNWRLVRQMQSLPGIGSCSLHSHFSSALESSTFGSLSPYRLQGVTLNNDFYVYISRLEINYASWLQINQYLWSDHPSDVSLNCRS